MATDIFEIGMLGPYGIGQVTAVPNVESLVMTNGMRQVSELVVVKSLLAGYPSSFIAAH